MICKHDTILFQGDSITDAGRDRNITEANNPSGLGVGYVHHTAAALLEDSPEMSLKIYNRGVGGNRITDLAERWHRDCLDLKPTLLSILIGVNDTWHEKQNPGQGVPLEMFDRVFRRLLDEARNALPDSRLVIGQPFALKYGAVDYRWYPEFTDRQNIVEQIAHDYRATFVSYQRAFDKAAHKLGLDYWTSDGVHPTTAGHMLMAKTWIKTVCGQRITVPTVDDLSI